MLTKYPIVDRKVEFGTFKTVLDRSAPEDINILLIKDNSGQGKTKLLNLYENHCRNNNIAVTRIDLKGYSLDPTQILRTIQADFRPINLKRCNDILSTSVPLPSTYISGNTGVGQISYSVNTNIEMANYFGDAKKNLYETGAQALLDDLGEIAGNNTANRFVILFDTYEQASDETKRWIGDHILRMATPRRTSSLLIVIAGIDLPTPTGEWDYCHYTLTLGPLELQDWIEYVGLIDKNIPTFIIERIFNKYKNSTIQMANALSMIAPVGVLSND